MLLGRLHHSLGADQVPKYSPRVVAAMRSVCGRGIRHPVAVAYQGSWGPPISGSVIPAFTRSRAVVPFVWDARHGGVSSPLHLS